MTNQIKYNWASLGTGVIANELAKPWKLLVGNSIPLPIVPMTRV